MLLLAPLCSPCLRALCYWSNWMLLRSLHTWKEALSVRQAREGAHHHSECLCSGRWSGRAVPGAGEGLVLTAHAGFDSLDVHCAPRAGLRSGRSWRLYTHTGCIASRPGRLHSGRTARERRSSCAMRLRPGRAQCWRVRLWDGRRACTASGSGARKRHRLRSSGWTACSCTRGMRGGCVARAAWHACAGIEHHWRMQLLLAQLCSITPQGCPAKRGPRQGPALVALRAALTAWLMLFPAVPSCRNTLWSGGA